MDAPGVEVDRHPGINFSDLNIPKIMILNKEYTNLDEKLKYIRLNKINMVFTHHHMIKSYEEKTGVKFIFWPFAVDQKRFKDYGLKKEYDLTFVGILRNIKNPQTQTDVRLKTQKHLYYCINDLRLFKKPKYNNLNFFWRGLPSSKVISIISKIIYGPSRYYFQDYYDLLNKTTICFNALAPLDLVSPRYYESMASKCLVLCQQSDVYKGLFEDGKHCITFKNDLSNFDEKLFYYLNNNEERKKIIENAHHHVLNHHTWEKRILQFTDELKNEHLI